MHGNHVEWCRDWYHAKLPGGNDPDLSSVKATQNRDGTWSRSRRGSAWGDDGWASRSAFQILVACKSNAFTTFLWLLDSNA